MPYEKKLCRTSRVILEYISPLKAGELMARIHVSLPDDPREIREHLNRIHEELYQEAAAFRERVNGLWD